MKLILSGTDRDKSNSLKISHIIQSLYKDQGEEVEVLDLADLPLGELSQCKYSKEAARPKLVQEAIAKVDSCEGLIVVCPEYNGSMPGALKLFIDYWSYPKSFEQRPVCFVGLGGRWGGLRPIEHLQGVFGYRNAFVFPQRIFISNVWDVLEGDKIKDEFLLDLMKKQVVDFSKFVKGLQSVQLDALSIN